MSKHSPSPRVGLFVTCLVDLMRPNVGFASVKLLEEAGCSVEVPAQTCCGQPAYNSGDLDDARALAKQTIAACEPFDYIVLPSGSCAATLKEYPQLLQEQDGWRARAESLAGKTFELTQFLTEVMQVQVEAEFPHRATYHDSCSGLRQLGIKSQPRRLLGAVTGLELREMADTDVCCGFGGTFCVKYPQISTRMVSDKVDNICATEAEAVLGGDLGCLLNIAGRLRRLHKPVKAYHVAEVLAGLADGPAIGEDTP
jgi:L-lactate dehydrogenase complex protein LldE